MTQVLINDIAEARGVTPLKIVYAANKFDVTLSKRRTGYAVHADDLPRLHKAIDVQAEINEMKAYRSKLAKLNLEKYYAYRKFKKHNDSELKRAENVIKKLLETKV